MQPEPLAPLAPPAFLANISASSIASVAFLLLFVLWLIYTVVASYHWMRYGHKSALALPAIGVHIMMSGYLALFAVSGFTG